MSTELETNLATLKLDSMVPVSEIRIGVDAVAPPREDGEPLLSSTEISIRARPE